MSCLRNQHGMSAVVIVTLMSLLLLFTTVGGMLVSKDTEKASGFLQSERALYLAESGLHMARYTLKNSWASWNNTASFPLTSFSGGTYDAMITDDNDGDSNMNSDANNKVVVTVTGVMGNSARTIRANVSRYGASFANALYTTGTVSESGNVDIHGNVVQNATTLPVLDVAAAIAAARANTGNGFSARPDGNYFQGDFSSNPSALNGVIFIDSYSDGSPASVNISGNTQTTSGAAVLIVLGNINISGTIGFDGLIYATGDVTLSINVSGNADIAGGIITSNNVNLSGNVDIEYSIGNMINGTTSSLFGGGLNAATEQWAEIFP